MEYKKTIQTMSTPSNETHFTNEVVSSNYEAASKFWLPLEKEVHFAANTIETSYHNMMKDFEVHFAANTIETSYCDKL
jgi:hypothetical protein